MSTPHDEHKDYEQLDEAIGHSTHKLFNMSPNDVLVQISLPVVLILAIATRLITIGQGMVSQNQSPAVLDLWKQHLILRVDRTLDEWEKTSTLPQFPDFSRVAWRNHWPEDDRFRQLCTQARALSNLDALTESLYRQALIYRPGTNAAGADSRAWDIPLFDPAYSPPTLSSNSIPADFRIDAARRHYAFQYITERCKRWIHEVEDLQWKLVERLAAELPPGDALADAELNVQMKKITSALEARGYPLLPTVSQEYRKEP